MMKYNFAEIGDNIVKERRKKHLSQDALIEELAKRGFKIGRNSISEIENGRCPKEISISLLLHLAEIFDCDVSYLLGENGEYLTKEEKIAGKITKLDSDSIRFLKNLNDDYSTVVNALLRNPEIIGNLLSSIDLYFSSTYESISVSGYGNTSTINNDLKYEIIHFTINQKLINLFNQLSHDETLCNHFMRKATSDYYSALKEITPNALSKYLDNETNAAKNTDYYAQFTTKKRKK